MIQLCGDEKKDSTLEGGNSIVLFSEQSKSIPASLSDEVGSKENLSAKKVKSLFILM